MTFRDVPWRERFDGVWASASLLHVPRRELPLDVRRLADALKPGGILFLSFKYGDQERQKDGRLFTDMKEATLQDLVAECDLELIDLWTSIDVRPGRNNERWVSALAHRR
jgi:hypothetical protein